MLVKFICSKCDLEYEDDVLWKKPGKGIKRVCPECQTKNRKRLLEERRNLRKKTMRKGVKK